MDVAIQNATFMWSNTYNDQSASAQNFILKIDNLVFKRDCVNLIVGPTGAGKTAVLMALLGGILSTNPDNVLNVFPGEMHFASSGPDSYFNLPRGKGVAYAAQEAWIENETIRVLDVFDIPGPVVTIYTG